MILKNNLNQFSEYPYTIMDLGKDPIPELIRKLAIPASIGFFFNTMFNVVDTFYAGKLSTLALAALSFSMTPFLGFLALGIGLGQASNALIGNEQGTGNIEKARFFMGQTIALGVIVSLVGLLGGWNLMEPLYRMKGAQGEFLVIALDYMLILVLMVPALVLNYAFNGILNSQGDTKSLRDSMIFGFIINLFLDPVLMFGFGPIPAQGVAGVAWATVIIQYGVTVFMGRQVMRTRLAEDFPAKMLIPRQSLQFSLLRQSVPASLNFFMISVGFYVILEAVTEFGEDAVAAYGIGTRIEQIILLLMVGLNISTLSITSYNFGARQYDRIREVYHRCLFYGVIMMLMGSLVLRINTEFWIRIFSESSEVVLLGSQFLQIESLILPSYVILFLGTSVLQGLKKPEYALFLNIYRLVFGPLLLFWYFIEVKGWGFEGIWWGIFWVNWIGVLLNLLLVHYFLPKTQSRFEANQNEKL